MENTSSSNIIEVRDLHKSFGKVTAVDGISFSVPRGGIFAFLGPNGAGKTTTIKMLTTLLHPTSGHLLVDGKDPVTQQDEARHSFGIVFQDPSLDDELTAEENLEFHGVLYGVPKKLRRERIRQAFDLVELWDRRNSLVKQYSGGMRRRLEIARSLIHHPRILFLDEPTLGLDPQTRNHIWGYIKELNKQEGMTIFFSTHYMDEAQQHAQMVAVIDHGHLIRQGSPQELMTATGKSSLEEAFLALTGDSIRREEASAVDVMRSHARAWGRGRK